MDQKKNIKKRLIYLYNVDLLFFYSEKTIAITYLNFKGIRMRKIKRKIMYILLNLLLFILPWYSVQNIMWCK